MTLKYIELSVQIHGLDADPDVLPYLTERLRSATRDILMGSRRDDFNFRELVDSDLEVTVETVAGSYSS